ncbi:MAG: PQQ-binding-like beta-propeller repeat protein [Maritimibacter sp.]|nr:PQQ-binding-like beta-propeller repeat protein [Maritimibacter sp.]
MKRFSAFKNLVLVSGLGLVAAGCSEREEILQGLREDLRSPGYDMTDPADVAAAAERAAADSAGFENTSRPANIGAPTQVSSWTHRAGNAAHDLPHGTLSAAPAVAFSSKAGAGNDRRYRITAEPVSDGARVYTMDSHAGVTAHGLGGGAVWSTDLTPPGEGAGSGSGGGLALSGSTLYATTSFGELVALDAGTGAVKWRQKFEAAVQGAPTVSGGKVYVASANSIAYAVATDTGRIAWRRAGVPSPHGVASVAAPAVSGNVVVYPLANRSLIGIDTGSGDVRWVARVAGGREGAARSVLRDFTGEPVIQGGIVYAANASGRAVAVGLQDGAIRWTADEGAQGTMAVAGGSVYFVNDQARLVRLSAQDGDKIWEVDLPRYEKADKPRKLKTIFPAYGPVFAGGRLWVASGDGLLRSYNPADGALIGSVALPAGAASRPIALAGMLMLMTTQGNLVGLR